MPLISINPTTGETIREFAELTPEQIGVKLTLAHTAFQDWKNKSFAERAEKLGAQPCQYCRDAVAADRTNQQENCSKMRKTLHVICALCWALFHFGLQILRLETFRFCRLGFYGVFFSCIEIRWYRASFSFFPRNHISPQFPQLCKVGGQQHAHVEGSGQHCNTCQLP